eukprot:TRINITY_DN64802_c0_g1_i1.p1 TRINITY_DN64802_c0_g1~~TRINITY_DN64802_c0_g1_i1.p1  ORF type:complete len:599 (+),score=151.00 TRINITY_DN64802_c0_g1_i1:97-1797(+)
MSGEGKPLDCLQRCLPCDLDDVLSYRMPRYVYMQHRMLGFTQWILSLGIFLYIVVYEIVIQKGWMMPQTPVGYSRFEVERPAWKDLPVDLAASYSYCCDPGVASTAANGCPIGWSTNAGLGAGNRARLPCLGWDEKQILQPYSGETSTFVATRMSVTTYSAVGASCDLNVNSACKTALAARTSTVREYYVADPEALHLQIQLTVFASRMANIRQSAGNVRGDDMVKGELDNHRGDFFMNFCSADQDDFVNSAIPANKRRGSRTDSEGTCDMNEERRLRYGDRLEVNQLLQAVQVGISGEGSHNWGCNDGLDCVNNDEDATTAKDTLRFDGVVILLPVIYAPSNKRGTDGALRYRYRPKWVRGAQWPTKYQTTSWSAGVQTTTEYRGIRVQLVHTGIVGNFELIEVLKTFIAGFALMAAVSFIIERVVLILPCWHGPDALFNRYAYIESHDFSEIIWKKVDATEDNPDPLPEAHLPLADGKTRKMRDKDFVYGDTHGRYQGKGHRRNWLCFRAAPQITEDGREVHPDSELDRYENVKYWAGADDSPVGGEPVKVESNEPVHSGAPAV